MTEELLLAVIAGVIVIILANTLSKRIGVAGPLILVVIGFAISMIPGVAAISIPPELILVGVLPPLLYSAAVSAPAIEFRRDLTAISGLSVLLVIISSLVLGVLFLWLIPEIGFPLAVALGAILSPTDAVATSVVRRLGVPRRVVTVLEGESLLNDATALVLLRTALVAVAAGFSLLSTLGSLLWAVLAALLVGAVVGLIALRLRAWLSSATANTALGLTIPYLAYLPAEALGGSGLVAAVVAGIVCGQGALRWLTPEQRISDKFNWHTIEFLLEGAIFLLMGLELYGIVENNFAADHGLLRGAAIAALAFVVLIAVRALYVVPMLKLHAAGVRRRLQHQLHKSENASRRPKRAGRVRADIDYFDASPLTWKHSSIIVWAGMRGAVTLAAAQTLPEDTPERDLIVFVAFMVAAGSLLLQGLTLPYLAKLLGLRKTGTGGPPRAEIRAIHSQLRSAVQEAKQHDAAHSAQDGRSVEDDGELVRRPFVTRLQAPSGMGTAAALELELELIGVMRARLHELGRSGRHSTTALRYVLDELDAYEISVRLHLESER